MYIHGAIKRLELINQPFFASAQKTVQHQFPNSTQCDDFSDMDWLLSIIAAKEHTWGFKHSQPKVTTQ